MPVDRGSATGVQGSSGRAASPSLGSVTSMEPRLLVVGGGRMGGALVHGLLACRVEPGRHRRGRAVRRASSRARRRAAGRRGAAPTSSPRRAAAVLAVKPADGEEACRALAARRDGPCPVDHGGGAPGPARVLAWPRARRWCGPCPTRRPWWGPGSRPWPPGSGATEADLAWAEELLGAVGRRGPAARGVARRRHRVVGLGPGLCLPRGRGPHRGRARPWACPRR